jgi:hypothetical protein
MARIVIRPDLTDTAHMVATAPVPKLLNAATGQVATDRESGAALCTVQLLETYGGTAQLIKVTVPEDGVDTSLTVGATVRPVGLIATPWASFLNGHISQGVAYCAQALTTVATAAEIASPAAAPQAVRS